MKRELVAGSFERLESKLFREAWVTQKKSNQNEAEVRGTWISQRQKRGQRRAQTKIITKKLPYISTAFFFMLLLLFLSQKRRRSDEEKRGERDKKNCKINMLEALDTGFQTQVSLVPQSTFLVTPTLDKGEAGHKNPVKWAFGGFFRPWNDPFLLLSYRFYTYKEGDFLLSLGYFELSGWGEEWILHCYFLIITFLRGITIG